MDECSATFDWTLGAQDHFDFNSFLASPGPGVSFDHLAGQAVQNSSESTEPSTTMPPESTSSSRATSLQKLTQALLDADDLCNNLPLQTKLHVSQAKSQIELWDKVPNDTATQTALERFFSLAQQLIDIYPVALDTAFSLDSDPDADCNIEDCTHLLELPVSLSKLDDEVEQRMRSSPDSALTNLLVSCHMRLLDTLDRLFIMVSSCTRVTVASQREPEFKLLEMRVGAFVPHKSAAVLMQIALLGHLVTGLADKVSMMGKTISVFAAERDADSDELAAIQSQQKLLTKRHNVQREHLCMVEDFLRRFDFQT